MVAAQERIGNREEGVSAGTERAESRAGGAGESVGLAAGAVESKQAGVGGFAGGLVLADAFPEFFLGGDNIEDVVDDLKGEAEGPAELREMGEGAGIGPGGHGTKP